MPLKHMLLVVMLGGVPSGGGVPPGVKQRPRVVTVPPDVEAAVRPIAQLGQVAREPRAWPAAGSATRAPRGRRHSQWGGVGADQRGEGQVLELWLVDAYPRVAVDEGDCSVSEAQRVRNGRQLAVRGSPLALGHVSARRRYHPVIDEVIAVTAGVHRVEGEGEGGIRQPRRSRPARRWCAIVHHDQRHPTGFARLLRRHASFTCENLLHVKKCPLALSLPLSHIPHRVHIGLDLSEHTLLSRLVKTPLVTPPSSELTLSHDFQAAVKKEPPLWQMPPPYARRLLASNNRRAAPEAEG
eukprot:scaffold8069_cov126-Isochrysis_galbana.AAC.8